MFTTCENLHPSGQRASPIRHTSSCECDVHCCCCCCSSSLGWEPGGDRHPSRIKSGHKALRSELTYLFSPSYRGGFMQRLCSCLCDRDRPTQLALSYFVSLEPCRSRFIWRLTVIVLVQLICTNVTIAATDSDARVRNIRTYCA